MGLNNLTAFATRCLDMSDSHLRIRPATNLPLFANMPFWIKLYSLRTKTTRANKTHDTLLSY